VMLVCSHWSLSQRDFNREVNGLTGHGGECGGKGEDR